MGSSATDVTVLREGFDRAVSALGSVLDEEQEPVADRLALLGHKWPAPAGSAEVRVVASGGGRRAGCTCTVRSGVA